MNNFAKFLATNALKRKDIASFLGVSGAFITQISSGDRPLPEEKLAMIKANPYGWDVSMLTVESDKPLYDPQTENLLSVYKRMYAGEDKTLIGYLQSQIEVKDALIREKDALINELYKQLGKYEAMLGIERKGELA